MTAVLLCAASPVAYGQSLDWKVSEVAGKVVIRDGAGERVASRGTAIAPGAILATGAGGRAVIVRGKDFVTVSASSRLRIPAVAEKRGLFEVLQEWGNAVFQIEKQTKPHFGVKTPYLAAVVKGTTFSVTVTGEGTSLQVIEGAVETSTIDGGASELIRPGMLATISAADQMRLTVQGQDTRTIDSPQRQSVQSSSPSAPMAEVEPPAPADAPAPAPIATTSAEPVAAAPAAFADTAPDLSLIHI